MSYLGLDIGTTGCKAAVFREDGTLAALAYREYPLHTPQPGWAEIDSQRVANECRTVIAEAVAKAPGNPVRAMGLSSQGEAFTPVGSNGEMLGRGMVSSDARAAGYVRDFAQRFDTARLYAITGHTPHPMFTLYKLLWLKRHQPDVWRSARQFLCFEDLLQAQLGIDPAMSWPLAGRTMLFDVLRHEWSGDVLEALELEPRRLARPLASGGVAGAIPAGIAGELGLPRDVLVVAGGHDQPCGALGAGATEPGVAMYASGTVECICPAFDRPIMTDTLQQANLCTYDYVLPGHYTTVLFSLTGGNLLRWFRDEFGQIEKLNATRSGSDAYSLLLEELATEPTDLLVLPYFTPSGTPYFDADLPGAILGLRLSTRRGEVLRALLEAVALEMRLNLDLLAEAGLATHELRAIGGGAKSRALVQLKADVTGRAITTMAVTEAACMGAAMLAAAAHTGRPAAELTRQWVRPTGAVEPDPARAKRYDERFATYRRLYPALSQVWKQLHS